MLKILLLIVLSSVEISNSAPRDPEPVTPLEVWNPLTWWIPFGIAQAESWSSYLKAAEQASSRLYRLIRSYFQSVRLFNRQNVNKQKQKEEVVQKGNRTTKGRPSKDGGGGGGKEANHGEM